MSEDHRIALVVSPHLPLGHLANTVATISVGLGAAQPYLAGTRLTDTQGRIIHVSANRPVPVLQADPDTILTLLLRALPTPEGAVVVAFPHFARALHSFAEYEATFPERDIADETIDGLGLAGPAKWVRSLTGALKLLR
jgi:hypothetical protein